MKKLIIGGLASLALFGGAVAGTPVAEAYARPKQCDADGWSGVSKVRAPKGTTCATASNVLATWMKNDGLEGETRIRVGRDGVLWKCYGSRDYGKLNPWRVYCWSSQKTWHYNAKYQISYWTSKEIWFNFRSA